MKPTLASATMALIVGATLVVADRGASAAAAAPPPGAKPSAADVFAAYSTKRDGNGANHTRYTRTYHGLRVYGGDIVVHTDRAGKHAGTSVGLTAPLSLSTTPRLSAQQAERTARKHFSGTIAAVDGTELFVDASSGRGRLAYETMLSGQAKDRQTPSVLHVITDANSGEFIGSFDEIESVTGDGNSIYVGPVKISTRLNGSTYEMVDPDHGNGNTCDVNNQFDQPGTPAPCTTFTDSDNVWGNGAQSDRQSAAVDAHYGAAKTYDYFKFVHGRNGIFGDGRGVPSRVHYGQNYVNAFWDGRQMTYGDGSGNARPLVSLDVAGHEMTHGVTENVVPGGLTYASESGGLNEATSDIFGSMVEFYAANGADPGDYDIGEKIDIFGNGKPLRFMYNPGLDGFSHTCWSTDTKNVDVHFSSGVGNHFFFNLAEGTGATPFGNSPVCSNAPAVVGIGRAKAERIWFRALDVYFTSSTFYVNDTNPGNTARAYTLQAAADLYGRCGIEYKAVQAAWTAVNVAGSDPACLAVVNSASFEDGPQALGSFISIFTSQPVTDENRTYDPWTDRTPGGLFVESSLCPVRPRILFTGPSGYGTQINLYYPNDYQGGRNTEPFGTCSATGEATFTVHPKSGSNATTTVTLVQSKVGIFLNFSAPNTPAGTHFNPTTNKHTSIATCNADPSQCPVSTRGNANFLILYTTGGEKAGCPTPEDRCIPAVRRPNFMLNGVTQQLDFYGWAGFLGQEQANVRIAADTPAGELKLSVTGANQSLTVRLGNAN